MVKTCFFNSNLGGLFRGSFWGVMYCFNIFRNQLWRHSISYNSLRNVNMSLLGEAMCEKCRSSHFQSEGGVILGLGRYQFGGEGYFCWGVSTPLHAMPSLSKKHDDITIKVNGIKFSYQKLVANKFNTSNLSVWGRDNFTPLLVFP